MSLVPSMIEELLDLLNFVRPPNCLIYECDVTLTLNNVSTVRIPETIKYWLHVVSKVNINYVEIFKSLEIYGKIRRANIDTRHSNGA